MRLGFETLGNATLVFYDNDRPVLATDPWLDGRCYFGSWALDRPLTEAERRRFKRRYFRRNPLGYLEWHARQELDALLDRLRWWSERFGVKRPLKTIYRRMIGDPVV
jgi:hypothetical protein